MGKIDGQDMTSQPETGKIYQGDSSEIIREWPDAFVNCCVTSPPYWGLRDYGMPGQLGLEKTPDEYISKLVLVFRDIRRVLRNDATLWLNIGDSYASSGRGSAGPSDKQSSNRGTRSNIFGSIPKGMKAKDLVGIPWMLAFALRSDGWYLRQDIIWAKPNPMPESVTDRCTKSHEYLFMLSKSARYFYDQEAIKESGSIVSKMPDGWDTGPGAHGAYHRNGREKGKTDKQRGHGRRHGGFNDRWDLMSKEEQCSAMRNKRDVWTISTQCFSEAHFATFPEKLIEPCIMAGVPEQGIVLDPFMGSGTTALVATRLGRKFIGTELNPEYINIAETRISQEMVQMKFL